MDEVGSDGESWDDCSEYECCEGSCVGGNSDHEDRDTESEEQNDQKSETEGKTREREKPFFCELCEVGFSRDNDKARHFKTGKKQRKSPSEFICACRKDYSRKDALLVLHPLLVNVNDLYSDTRGPAVRLKEIESV